MAVQIGYQTHRFSSCSRRYHIFARLLLVVVYVPELDEAVSTRAEELHAAFGVLAVLVHHRQTVHALAVRDLSGVAHHERYLLLGQITMPRLPISLPARRSLIVF